MKNAKNIVGLIEDSFPPCSECEPKCNRCVFGLGIKSKNEHHYVCESCIKSVKSNFVFTPWHNAITDPPTPEYEGRGLVGKPDCTDLGNTGNVIDVVFIDGQFWKNSINKPEVVDIKLWADKKDVANLNRPQERVCPECGRPLSQEAWEAYLKHPPKANLANMNIIVELAKRLDETLTQLFNANNTLAKIESLVRYKRF